MPPRRHVMLMVETSLGFGRDVLSGVSKYLIQHGPWSVHLGYKELISDPPEWLHGWDGDGVISRSTTPELAEWFVQRGLPVVDLTDMYGRNALPSIWNDHEQIGEMGSFSSPGARFPEIRLLWIRRSALVAVATNGV